MSNVVHVSSKSKFRKKLNKLLDFFPNRSRASDSRRRSQSRSLAETGYFRVPENNEEDEEKMAERIAAMIVSDVMRANQQLQQQQQS